jgi:hypothetical protein
MLGKILVWISPLLHPNTKRQREGRVATVNFDQMRGKGAGVVKEVVWWSFKLIWVSYVWR